MIRRPPGTPRSAAAIVLAVLLLAGCAASPTRDGGSTPTPSPRTAASPGAAPSPRRSPPGTPPPLRRVEMRLERVATLEQPVALAVRSGDQALYVAQKTGRVVALRDGEVDPRAVLDLSEAVSTGYEQGLLGIAFSPDGRFLYVNYTDAEGDTRVVQYAMGDSRARRSTRRELLFVDQPFSNHNGGNLAFGPDGHLYVGLGDGGSGGDPQGNAQRLDTLLGKMLRITPRPGGGTPYTIPRGNPFVGDEGARGEIWAIGLRNPWRYSFDRETGDLWIGDVGQGSWEEVDFQPAGSGGGENYGWDLMEGRHRFEGPPPPDHVPPVFEYETRVDGTCAVTGGYVYRGTDIPDLVGAYLFGDFCRGKIRALRVEEGTVTEEAALGPLVPGLASFGEDASGELYALSLEGPVYRIRPG